MSKTFNQIKLLLFLIVVLPAATYANYTITPVVLNLKKGAMVTSVTITNNADETSYFQLSVYETDENKHTLGNETKDLIAAPAMFKIKGTKSQIIRIAIKNSEAVFKHKYYLLSMRELAHGPGLANTVKFVKEYRLPVTFGDDDGDKKHEELR